MWGIILMKDYQKKIYRNSDCVKKDKVYKKEEKNSAIVAQKMGSVKGGIFKFTPKKM